LNHAAHADRWAAPFERLGESGQEDEMTNLRPFLVEIAESGPPEVTTWMKFHAEDAGHALEQARNAVPDGRLGVARDLKRWAHGWEHGDSRCPRCDSVETIEVGGPQTRDGLGYREPWWCAACLAEWEVSFEESAVHFGEDRFVRLPRDHEAAIIALRACRDALAAHAEPTDVTRSALASADEALSAARARLLASKVEGE
jgi:hypothetical protein